MTDYDAWTAPHYSVEVAPTTPMVLRVPQCEGPEASRCLVCRLEVFLERAPETAKVFAAARPDPEPLHLNIVGLRRQNSLSDAFDDYLAAFFTLPHPDQFEDVKSAVESGLRDDLEKAAGAQKAKERIKVVHCSRNGTWVVGLFKITTDPGFLARKSDIEDKKTEIKATEDLKAARKKLDDDVKSATDEFAKTGEALKKESAKRPVDAAALSAARDAYTQARTTLNTAAATRTQKGLKTTDHYDHVLQTLQKAKQGLEERFQDYQQHHSSKRDAKQEDGVLEVSGEGQSGFFAEGRAMIRGGHFPEKYRYFIHHAAQLDETGSHTCLWVDVMPGVRVWSVKHVVENPRRFIETVLARKVTRSGKTTDHGKQPVTIDLFDTSDPKKREVVLDGEALADDDELVLAKTGKPIKVAALATAAPTNPRIVYRIKKPDGAGERLPVSPSTVLALVRSGSSVKAYLDTSGKRSELEEGTQIQLITGVLGTNIHRAHNTDVNDSGQVEGGGESRKVSNWSEGCQTFPRFEDFNLFLRMCAVAKRWKCASEGIPVAADCQRLETKGKDESAGPGEKILSEWKSGPFDVAADDAYARGDAQRGKELKRRRALEDKLGKKKTLNPEEQHELDDLEEKHAEWTKADDWQKARRKLVWAKTRFFQADWLRACDLKAQCGQRFGYTLLELPSADLESLAKTFDEISGPAWDGKVVP